MWSKSAIVAGLAFGAGAYLLSSNAANSRPLPEVGTRVLILGAGFGGLAAARQLARLGRTQLRITVVDQHNYHLFTPLLYQAATCGIVPYDAVLPVRQWTGRRRVAFRQGRVRSIDLDGCTVHLDNGDVPYDYLVIALGSTTNFFGNESASRHALSLKTMEEGVAIRNHIIDTLEKAAVASNSDERRKLLTYVIVGGGATGVETAGAIAGLLREVLPTDYRVLQHERWRVIVLESESKLLGHMSNAMAATARRELQAAGVEVRLNTRAQDITPDHVTTASGERIGTGTVIWATGVRVADEVAKVAAEHGHGGSLIVDEYLRVKGRSDAYAIGDNAHVVDRQTNKPVPLLAASAMQEGSAAGRNIARALVGRRLRPFRYRNLGNVVSVGSRSGVAEIGGRILGGFAGWLAWRAVHLARLTSTRNQLATALDWTVGYFYDIDTAKLELQPDSPRSRAA